MARVCNDTAASVTLAECTHMTSPFWLLLVPGSHPRGNTHLLLSLCLEATLGSCRCLAGSLVTHFPSPGSLSDPCPWVPEREGRPLGLVICIFSLQPGVACPQIPSVALLQALGLPLERYISEVKALPCSEGLYLLWYLSHKPSSTWLLSTPRKVPVR